MVKYENERSPQKREQYFKKLTEVKAKLIAPEITEVLEYVSEWYHPVIREMTGLDTFYSDPAWIAKNLHYKLMPMQAKESLELLEKLDLIEFNADEGRHGQKVVQLHLKAGKLPLSADSIYPSLPKSDCH